MVIAAQNQRWFVGRADGNLATNVGNLLRWPDGTSAFSVATASLYLDDRLCHWKGSHANYHTDGGVPSTDLPCCAWPGLA